MSKAKILKLLLIISMCCYLLSWALPALIFDGGKLIWPGWMCFVEGVLLGWLDLHFEAFANVLYVVALCFAFREKWSVSGWLSGIGSLLAAQTFTLTFIQLGVISSRKTYLTGYGPGFYLWILSFSIVFFVSLPELVKGIRNYCSRKAPVKPDSSEQGLQEEL